MALASRVRFRLPFRAACEFADSLRGKLRGLGRQSTVIAREGKPNDPFFALFLQLHPKGLMNPATQCAIELFASLPIHCEANSGDQVASQP